MMFFNERRKYLSFLVFRGKRPKLMASKHLSQLLLDRKKCLFSHCPAASKLYVLKTYLRCLMDILLKDVTVSDPSSSFHLQRVSIFIHDGIITEIGTISREAEQTVSMP